jgi:hypothetical protein
VRTASEDEENGISGSIANWRSRLDEADGLPSFMLSLHGLREKRAGMQDVHIRSGQVLGSTQA